MSSRRALLLAKGFFLAVCVCIPCASYAQRGGSNLPTTNPMADTADGRVSLVVMIRDASGGPVDSALASLNSTDGGILAQSTAAEGRVEFNNLVPGDYSLTVAAAGYDTYKQIVNVIYQGTISYVILRVSGEEGSDGSKGGPPVLAPKARKELMKAIDALRVHKPDQAREPLDRALHLAPTHPDVEYVYGLYYMELQDWPQAMTHWEKALSLYPKHYNSLLFMGEGMLIQKKPQEAVGYLNQAAEQAPSAWRPHALLAQADLVQHNNEQAVQEAERAIKLGHADASGVEPLLADALVAQGNRQRAITVLEQYVKEHPQDARAQKNLEVLRGMAAHPDAPATPDKKSPPPSGGTSQP